MAALTADLPQEIYGGIEHKLDVAASTTIYKGSLVCYDAGGDIIPAADTAGIVIAGVAMEYVDNSSGADGDKQCAVRSMCVAKFDPGALVEADKGKNCFAADDQGVDDGAALTNDVKVGTFVELHADGDALVLVGVFAATDA